MIEPSRVVIGKEPRPLSELIREASAALRDSSASADERIRRTDEILEKWTYAEAREVSEAIRSNRLPRGGLAAWQVRRVKLFVADSLGRRIDISELASLTGFSPAHFSRSFRVSFNETPHRYVVRHARRAVSRGAAIHRHAAQPGCDRMRIFGSVSFQQGFQKNARHQPWRVASCPGGLSRGAEEYRLRSRGDRTMTSSTDSERSRRSCTTCQLLKMRLSQALVNSGSPGGSLEDLCNGGPQRGGMGRSALRPRQKDVDSFLE